MHGTLSSFKTGHAKWAKMPPWLPRKLSRMVGILLCWCIIIYGFSQTHCCFVWLSSLLSTLVNLCVIALHTFLWKEFLCQIQYMKNTKYSVDNGIFQSLSEILFTQYWQLAKYTPPPLSIFHITSDTYRYSLSKSYSYDPHESWICI